MTSSSASPAPIPDLSRGRGISSTIVDRAQSAVRDATRVSESIRPIRVALILYRDDLNVGGSLRVAEVLANSLDPARVDARRVHSFGR